jgi:hypothetical protein
MKKLLLASLVLASLSSYAQTKKVILHDYTGVNCQYCTDGTVVIEGMISSNPTTFIPIQIHTGSYTNPASPMKTAEGDAFNTAAAPSGYPAGSVDMVKYSTNTTLAMGRGSWNAAFGVQKAKTALASVSINNRVDKGSDAYEADIDIVFTTAPAAGVPIKVNFMILEDSIKADGTYYQQINYSGGPYGGASPLTYAIHKYVHNNVLRKTLGTTWGYAGVIPATPVIGTKYTKKVSFTLDPSWVKKNLRVVAYVAYDGTAMLTDKEIINAEMLKLNSFFKVGVNNVAKNIEILNVYPSPAKIGDVINVEYNTTETGNVTMNVYNVAGQKVATPYSSYDAAGGHTMQFKTSLYSNLTPGTYVLEVVSASGKQTQKIVLQ